MPNLKNISGTVNYQNLLFQMFVLLQLGLILFSLGGIATSLAKLEKPSNVAAK